MKSKEVGSGIKYRGVIGLKP